MKNVLFVIVVLSVLAVGVNAQTITPITNIHNQVGVAPNDIVTIRGIVAAHGTTGSGRYAYIQDAVGAYNGIRVGNNLATSFPSDIAVGDEYTVTGQYMEYYTESEVWGVIVSGVTRESVGNSRYAPVLVTGADIHHVATDDPNPGLNIMPMEQYEGVLAEVHNVTITSTTEFFGVVLGTDDGGTSIINIDGDFITDPVNQSSFQVGHVYNITGVVRYNFGRYRLLPTTVADIVDLAALPPQVTSAQIITENKVVVSFDMGMGSSTANVASNYSVAGVGNPSSAVLQSNALDVVLTFASNFAETTVYTVTVSNVQSVGGQTVDPGNNSANFSYTTPDVTINEVMYDSKSTTDVEWLELYNTTASPIDVGGWILSDAPVEPSSATTEGVVRIPTGTSIPANGYLVLSVTTTTNIPSAVILEVSSGSFIFGNSGDNISLYNGTTLIDGSLTDAYPDLSPGNVGSSIEKLASNFPWTNSPYAWQVSLSSYAGSLNSVEFFKGTPGLPNSNIVPPASAVEENWEIYR